MKNNHISALSLFINMTSLFHTLLINTEFLIFDGARRTSKTQAMNSALLLQEIKKVQLLKTE